jgi:uncharacterized protein (TIGR02118 family)
VVMHITFVSFNFKGSDTATEERHYLDYHVALAKSFPGVSLYLHGRLLPADGVKPDRFRAAILGFDTLEASAGSMSSEASTKVMADTQERLTDLRLEAFESEVVVPFEKARPGTARFVWAVAFDFKPDQGDLETAERNYKARHVELARKLPGLKGYMIARLGGERQRIGIMMFDSFDRFREAMKSPIGQDVTKDGMARLANVRFVSIDARVEV